MMPPPSGDWSIFKQIFTDHWDTLQRVHPRYQTSYYNGLVTKMLACGNPEKIGYIWVNQVSKALHEGVIYRHIILTVPAMFRTPFYRNAAVVRSAFMRCGRQCLNDFYSEVRGKALRGGYIMVLHTHGRYGQYHPHLHLLATSGGYDDQGERWDHLQYLPYALLRRK
jgi:hypothetical protein